MGSIGVAIRLNARRVVGKLHAQAPWAARCGRPLLLEQMGSHQAQLSGRRWRIRLPSRWPPSAAQTVRAVFPHTAFTKTQTTRYDPGLPSGAGSAPVRLIQFTSLLGR